MTPHEQTMFNDAVDRLKALQWQERVIAKLRHKLEPLGASQKIALLKRVEEQL